MKIRMMCLLLSPWLVKISLLWYAINSRINSAGDAAYNKGGESFGSKRYGNNEIYETE